MPRAAKSDVISSTSSDAPAGELTAIAAKTPASMTEPERVEQTVQWLLTGARDAEIVEAIGAHWPDQDLGQLINAAVANLAESATTEADVVRGWCFEATKHLYKQMVSIGDFAGALRAVKMINDLAGR